MSSLTALEPRPFILERPMVNIELVPATAEDLKVLDHYDAKGNKVYKVRLGMVYWLRSSLKNQIEPTPRQITEDTNPKDIKQWLDHNMIYIAKNEFEI